jgi:hypothetical protein
LTGNPFFDGLLIGQAFPGGMVLSGANGAPIVIIIVNAAPVDTTAESARKRRER